MPRTSDKRERLVDAATQLIHSQGYAQTSLADIAEQSGVPLGNVYYYFKTKDELGGAVMEKQADQFFDKFAQWDGLADPRKRLLTYLDMAESIKQMLTEHGCPIGSLCQELGKERTALTDQASHTLQGIVDWISHQYKELNQSNPRELGMQFVVSLQGAILMASALNKQSVLANQIKQLRQQVNSL